MAQVGKNALLEIKYTSKSYIFDYRNDYLML